MNAFTYVWGACGMLAFYAISMDMNVLAVIMGTISFVCMIISIMKQADDDAKK